MSRSAAGLTPIAAPRVGRDGAGRIVGTWRPNRRGRKVDIAVKPFAEPPKEIAKQIAAETAYIERFLSQ